VVALPIAQALRTGGKAMIMIESPPATDTYGMQKVLENIFDETNAQMAKRFDNTGFWCSEVETKTK
jgi:hypothetical protein